MKIEVTQKDIDEAIPRAVTLCPIALAVKRSTNFKRVYVNCTSINVLQYGKGVKTYRLPKKAQTFVKHFDGERTHGFVKPFSFELENL